MRFTEYLIKTKRIDPQNFKYLEWFDDIEDIVIQKTGQSLLDLPDQPYTEKYDAGLSAVEMSKVIIDQYITEMTFIAQVIGY
jgi:hypothetical protein